MYKDFVKPIFDIVIASVVFVLLFPIFFLVLVITAITNSGKPLFTQLRPGKNEKIFKIIKFKTMNDIKSNSGELLPDSDRLTPLGSFIRKTSLDEIPQLLNVIKGDMSLIGPRPLLVEYLPLYSMEQKKRHLIKPGITGWAQVNGRNTIGWVDKFKLDVYYVNNCSFYLDMIVVFLTIKKVFLMHGIAAKDMVTMTKFKGLE